MAHRGRLRSRHCWRSVGSNDAAAFLSGYSTPPRNWQGERRRSSVTALEPTPQAASKIGTISKVGTISQLSRSIGAARAPAPREPGSARPGAVARSRCPQARSSAPASRLPKAPRTAIRVDRCCRGSSPPCATAARSTAGRQVRRWPATAAQDCRYRRGTGNGYGQTPRPAWSAARRRSRHVSAHRRGVAARAGAQARFQARHGTRPLQTTACRPGLHAPV